MKLSDIKKPEPRNESPKRDKDKTPPKRKATIKPLKPVKPVK